MQESNILVDYTVPCRNRIRPVLDSPFVDTSLRKDEELTIMKISETRGYLGTSIFKGANIFDRRSAPQSLVFAVKSTWS
jgi:hypothetical protein